MKEARKPRSLWNTICLNNKQKLFLMILIHKLRAAVDHLSEWIGMTSFLTRHLTMTMRIVLLTFPACLDSYVFNGNIFVFPTPFQCSL